MVDIYEQMDEALWKSAWRKILGVSEDVFSGQSQACPNCTPPDRMRESDRFRWEGGPKGQFFCNGCGAGFGLDLIRRKKGWGFAEAARQVRELFGLDSRTPGGSTPRRQVKDLSWLVQKVLGEAKTLSGHDTASRYLLNRGFPFAELPPEILRVLRFHPDFEYLESEKDKEGKLQRRSFGRHPVLLAPIKDQNGSLVNWHQTYLTAEGFKNVSLPAPKKYFSVSTKGTAIRLFPAAEEMGVAEGIETSIAAWLLKKIPVWCCLNGGCLESWPFPPGLKMLHIFGDNDTHHAGQAHAYSLSHRARKQGIRTVIHLPYHEGEDWADVWVKRNAKRLQTLRDRPAAVNQ